MYVYKEDHYHFMPSLHGFEWLKGSNVLLENDSILLPYLECGEGRLLGPEEERGAPELELTHARQEVVQHQRVVLLAAEDPAKWTKSSGKTLHVHFEIQRHMMLLSIWYPAPYLH